MPDSRAPTTQTPYPGYDVLDKRHSPSWNAATRRVIDARLAIPREPHFFDQSTWETLAAVCDRLIPQPDDRPPVPIASMIDQKLLRGEKPGYRHASLPPQEIAWRRGLTALNSESQTRYNAPFAELSAGSQTSLLKDAKAGRVESPAWEGIEASLFFSMLLLPEVLAAYYAHPTAWSEIGFGGPASPRGYVRMGLNRRDPWEPIEAGPDDQRQTRRENRRVR